MSYIVTISRGEELGVERYRAIPESEWSQLVREFDDMEYVEDEQAGTRSMHPELGRPISILRTFRSACYRELDGGGRRGNSTVPRWLIATRASIAAEAVVYD